MAEVADNFAYQAKCSGCVFPQSGAEEGNIGQARRPAKGSGTAVNGTFLEDGIEKTAIRSLWRSRAKKQGAYRTTARNIGIEAYRIPAGNCQAPDDAKH